MNILKNRKNKRKEEEIEHIEETTNLFEYDIEIEKEFRGYNKEQVEEYITKLTEEYSHMYEEYKELEKETQTLRKRNSYFEQNATEILELSIYARKLQKKTSRNQTKQITQEKTTSSEVGSDKTKDLMSMSVTELREHFNRSKITTGGAK